MKKTFLCALFASIMLVSACSTNATTETKEPVIPDLTGEWIQEDANKDEMYQAATITADAMTINWVNDSEETEALYWAGTFTAPVDDTEPYVWVSENDTEQTSKALLASGADTKEFTYEDNKISYEAKAMGVTKTVYLIKAE